MYTHQIDNVHVHYITVSSSKYDRPFSIWIHFILLSILILDTLTNLLYSVGESVTKEKRKNHGNCNATTATDDNGVDDKNV